MCRFLFCEASFIPNQLHSFQLAFLPFLLASLSHKSVLSLLDSRVPHLKQQENLHPEAASAFPLTPLQDIHHMIQRKSTSFPGGASGKETHPTNAGDDRDSGSIPGLGENLLEDGMATLQYYFPGESHETEQSGGLHSKSWT